MPGPKQYQLVVSPRAAHQLQEHASFAARLDEGLAHALIRNFQEAAGSLAHMPFQAPFLDSDVIPSKKYRKLLFGKWYLLLYQVRNNTVYIEYVIDGRQDYEWLIQ